MDKFKVTALKTLLKQNIRKRKTKILTIDTPTLLDLIIEMF